MDGFCFNDMAQEAQGGLVADSAPTPTLDTARALKSAEMRARTRLERGHTLHRVPRKNQARMGSHLVRNAAGRMVWKGELEELLQ